MSSFQRISRFGATTSDYNYRIVSYRIVLYPSKL